MTAWSGWLYCLGDGGSRCVLWMRWEISLYSTGEKTEMSLCPGMEMIRIF